MNAYAVSPLCFSFIKPFQLAAYEQDKEKKEGERETEKQRESEAIFSLFDMF